MPPRHKPNISGPPLQVQKTPVLKGKHFKSSSSRTFAYIIVHGHNSFWTQNTSSRTYKYIISKDTSTSSRTYAYLISISFPTMPMLHQRDTHFNSHRSWDSFPYRPRRRHEQATTSYSPSSHRSWNCYFAMDRGGGTNRLPRVPSCAAAKSLTECSVKKTEDTGEVKSMKIWTFHNDCNVTKQNKLKMTLFRSYKTIFHLYVCINVYNTKEI